ncbi:MAG: hypothetical protein EDM74_07640 [Armatimonadetes bacterium]|nr:MAG: hypothetical protein EDM74_07640 [Armatimonadota bacterium]
MNGRLLRFRVAAYLAVVGCTAFGLAQTEWEAAARRDQAPDARPAWIQASRDWLAIKGGSDTPAGLGELISATWKELFEEASHLEADRKALMAEVAEEGRAVVEHNAEADRQVAAGRAHESRGPHQCPCQELINVNAWADRIDARMRELIEWRRTLSGTILDWDERVELFDEGVGDLATLIEEATTSIREVREERRRLQDQLDALRGEVQRTQEALRSLQKSIVEGNKESARWRAAAVGALWSSAKKTCLAALDGAISSLELAHKARLDIEALKAKKLAVETLDTAASDVPTHEKVIDTAMNSAAFAFGRPEVQQAIRYAGVYGKVISGTKAVLDFGLDVETFWRSYLRLTQNIKNADGYLAAVKSLSGHMEKLVRKIQDVKSQLGP